MEKQISIEALYELYLNCNQKITTDTRKIEKGSIFFALRGDNFDANTFANNAIELGCKYAIVSDKNYSNEKTIFYVDDVLHCLQNLAKYHRSRLEIPVIGITGSNGKTTNKELIYAVLSKKYNTLATKGNLNNHIGVPLTILEITKNDEIAIIEMGANHQKEIDFLCNIANPDYGLITNIGKAHLEGFGGEEGVKIGKSEMYKFIKNKNGKIFINADDKVLESLSIEIEKIYYGGGLELDIHGELITNSEYVELKWATKNVKITEKDKVVKTHLFGHYNFTNVLCAICIGNYFKVDDININDALSNYIPEMNRSQVKKTKNNTLILDSYNANPSSMQLAVKHFVNQDLQNKVVILGDMFELGEFSKHEHESILNELVNCKDLDCIMVGEHFYNFKNKFLGFSFYNTIEDLIEQLKNNQLTGKSILIKGSRGIKLEKLEDYL